MKLEKLHANNAPRELILSLERQSATHAQMDITALQLHQHQDNAKLALILWLDQPLAALAMMDTSVNSKRW